MHRHALFGAAASLAVVVACSSSTPTPPSDAGPQTATCASPGAAASGPADSHCTAATPTNPAACNEQVEAGPPELDDAGLPVSDFGPTMFGTQGDDDDCKYHVSWTSTPICEGSGGVLFTVTATKKADGTPLTGAYPYVEAFLNDKHLSPDAGNYVEKGNGVYDVGPIVFDQPGRWTVRFHFYGNCQDISDDSPHGHAAFFVDVP